ncbi:MAG: RNA methyltransferase [Bacteroidetes bacterium HGW-Bacteroidetes-3]|jgi:16S rRNA (cytosine967-C5)-methyltransferase|nr:MAG: RNA methyltransferase [Bacteroidetes bacterium HGW-Bacteroidetes-3]
MRLHRNLVFTVIDSVKSIFNEGEYADKAVEKALKRDARWGARDRKFVAETIYEMVRWKRLYNEIAGTKEHYTTENVWKNFSVWAILKGVKLPEWNQLQGVPERRIKGKFDELQKVRVFKESIPDWMDEMGVKELGEAQWSKEIHKLNEQADVILRANTLKTTKANLQKKLMDEGIETEFIQGYNDALKLVERANVFKTEVFKLGFFEVQDASSQLVAEYLDVKPGMRVIDTCAGAGGKSLHLAALMENKGQIIATDIYESKLRKLKIRTRRAGVHNITTKEIDSPKVMKKMKGTADRVLIDAPCSGIGVLKRNPDSKWKLEPEFVENIIKTQAEILENYSQLVKPGGKLVYATCSIFPSENEKQVHGFLKNHPEFEFEKEHKVSPAKSGFDGFYMALIRRVE